MYVNYEVKCMDEIGTFMLSRQNKYEFDCIYKLSWDIFSTVLSASKMKNA